MRIISPPISEMPLRPVEVPQGIRNRVPRDSAPGTDNKVSDSTNSASGGQRVFHATHGGPAETSLPEVSRAYTKTDSLRFKDVPFTVRVV